MEDKQYIEYVHANAQKSAHVMTLVWAFLVGGVICCIGQGFGDIFALVLPDWEKSKIAALVSMTMIFLVLSCLSRALPIQSRRPQWNSTKRALCLV